jgi:hypothetical protein
MDEPAFTIRIPKRWLQFRLWSLLLLMLGLAVALVLYVKRPAPAVAPLAMEGYCPVTLAKRMTWVQGDPQYAASHGGATYHLAGRVELDQFMRDRRQYAPVMGCADVVLAKKSGQMRMGLRRYGYRYRGRFYLFSDPISMDEFKQKPQVYAQYSAEWERAH